MPRSLIEAGNTQSATTNTVTVAGSTIIPNMVEKTVVHTGSPSGAVEIDLFRGTVHYFTTSASNDFQFNFLFSSTPGGINTVLSAGQSLTVAVLVTNGATAYRVNNILLNDIELIAPVKWNGANGAPSEGTENSIDTYVFTFIKKLNGSLEILGNAKSTGGTFGAGAGPLYSFTSATFSTNTSGPNGPDLSGARSSLSVSGDSSWTNNTEYFNVTSGFQYFTVPETATYRITTAGARGGQSQCYGPQGGQGAQMRGDFELAVGTVLKMVVGQTGENNCYDCGGGGGSFVCLQDNTPVIIAGGGGGGSASGGSSGTTSTSGQSASSSGGSNGGGGGGSTAGGGGGLTGNGGGSWFGASFTNGAVNASAQARGGFGGGGGGGGTNGAGGGGGYSGGSYSNWSSGGGGGGSFNSGSNQSNSSGVRSGNGFITIEKL